MAMNFVDEQQKYPRPRQAREEKLEIVKELFSKAGVEYIDFEILLRILKEEKELEVWAKTDTAETYVLIKTYAFTAFSGTLGPKRRQGDLQIPEGVYHIDRYNPASNFHLSLGLNYPNKSDRIRKSAPDSGGDIFIHGNAVTIGCIPLGDEAIKELYTIAVDARSNGQTKIPVYIFPCRMTDKGNSQLIQRLTTDKPKLKSFWDELMPIYKAFDSLKVIPRISIDSSGQYQIKGH
ncbi:MAG: L,D-transpeptidase family protein [candidate division Zixibacteria bacterium]|nr:L,D-transpeptidase family protein [candidate division Zixibacteria bacterium]